MKSNNSVSLKVPARAEFIDVVRLTLYGISSKWGFSFEEIEDMKVAVAEACNNAVLHAYQDQDQGQIEVTFEMRDDGIRISVKDAGISFNYEHEESQSESLHNKPLDEIDVGGLGIFMMQALMDEVEVHSESGTEVILTKFLQRNEELA